MAQGNWIRAADLCVRPAGEAAIHPEDMSLEEVERFLIRKALARHEGNAKKAADALGLSRSAFYRRLEKYGL
jgi:DNA-binding NtrC family response regulator